MTQQAEVIAAALAEEHNPLIPAWYDIIGSALVLVIIGFVFAKFILPKLNAVLDERTKMIEGGINQAANAKAEAEKLMAQAKTEVDAAHAEAAKIREEARAEGSKIIAEMREQAKSESERLVQTAHVQLTAERQQVVNSLRTEVGTLATDLASKIVGESLTDYARSTRVVDRFIEDLEKNQSLVSTQEQ
ncbi:F0F1 ATP synthase subunit B [Micrococcales bacterium 31B]|nr:F0F1 ATP synthase subunit B [Micrococcales bacterium 31B]